MPISTITDSAADQQSVDLLSGLTIRRPKLSRSGFFSDARGTVVTTAEVIDSCTRITLDEETDAIREHLAELRAMEEILGISI